MVNQNDLRALAQILLNANMGALEEFKKIISQHPESLSTEMDSLLAAGEWNQKTETARKLFEHLRNFLSECRKNGIEKAFEARRNTQEENKKESPSPVLIRLLQQFFAAEMEDKKRIVLENPVLLSKEVDDILQNSGDERTANKLAQYRKMFDLCREMGVEAAFDQQMAYQQQSGKSEMVMGLVMDIVSTGSEHLKEKIIRNNPQILEKEVEDLVRLFVSQYEGNSDAKHLLIDCADLLRSCREKGIDAVFGRLDEISTVELLEKKMLALQDFSVEDPQVKELTIDTCVELLEYEEIQNDPYKQALYRYALALALIEADQQKTIEILEEALQKLPVETAPDLYGSIVVTVAGIAGDMHTGDRESNQMRALTYYYEAFEIVDPKIYPKIYSWFSVNSANILMDFSGGKSDSNIELAIIYLNKGVDFCDPENDSKTYIFLQIGLGNAHVKRHIGTLQNNLTTALGHYEKALQVSKNTNERDLSVSVLTNMAAVYKKMSGYSANAADLLEKAIDCMHNAYGLTGENSNAEKLGTVLINLGALYAGLPPDHPFSKDAKGEKYLLRALEMLDPVEYWEEYAGASGALADYYFNLELWESALPALNRAIEAHEASYQRHYFRSGRQKVLKKMAGYYDELAYILSKLGKFEQALEAAEKGRSRFIHEQMQLRAQRPHTIPDEVWEEYSQAAYSLCIFDWEESNYQRSLKDSEEWYLNAISRLDQSIQNVRKHDDSFCRETEPKKIIREIKNDRVVILFICITRKGSIGLILDKSEQVSCIDLPDFNTTKLRDILWGDLKEDAEYVTGGWLGSYFRINDESDIGALESWSKKFQGMLNVLGQNIAIPVNAALPADIDNLICVLPGDLALLPLHAAPLNNEGELIFWDRFAISYLPSLALFPYADKRWPEDVIPGMHAAVNPTNDKKLVFTWLEALLIKPVFKDSTFYYGAEATREKIGRALTESAIVHLSCHSGFDWRNPRNSGIVLSDGIIKLDEIMIGDIDLEKTEEYIIAVQIRPKLPMLVTLSSCETGMIDFMEGSSNEFLGMSTGLLLCGFPAVVSSLWKVADISSAVFMWKFYSRLSAGISVAMALREAGIWLRDVTANELAQTFFYEMQKKEDPEVEEYGQLSNAWRRFSAYDPEERPFKHPSFYAAYTANGSTLRNIFTSSIV